MNVFIKYFTHFYFSIFNYSTLILRKYFDLIDQTFYFPTAEFHIESNELLFHNIPLMDLIRQYGTPLKISYLPKIDQQIQKARACFQDAFKKYNYQGKYTYCYCTKSSHFKFILERVLKNNTQIETSSAYDIDILKKMYADKMIDKNLTIICNGFKLPRYTKGISELINNGFQNCIPVLDSKEELPIYLESISKPFDIGIRMAAEEKPNFDFYTSRLGIQYENIVSYYLQEIAPQKKVQLKLLHFFINSGISDDTYYWSELSKFVYKYCELKKHCPELDTIDIGGGFPIKTSLGFKYDYGFMIEQIVEQIQTICKKHNVAEPNIITEFGAYTVGESGATIFEIVGQKLQNDKELWYMIDGSFITHLPDTWATNQKFVMLALNKWNNEYQQVHLGGITCDSDDFYNSEIHSAKVFLPKIDENPLYIGFFHTGAYQESIGGFGGLQHCLIPTPQHIIIDKKANGEIVHQSFAEQQKSETVLKTLGY